MIFDVDTVRINENIYIGGNTLVLSNPPTPIVLINNDIEKTPDWFFFITLIAVLSVAWVKLIYTKFVLDFISSAINYNAAVKVYSEPGIVRKRVGYYLNILFLISGSLYLFILFNFYGYSPFGLTGHDLLLFSLGILSAFIIYRIVIAKLISFLFLKEELFSQFIHHYFLYNKLLGLVLLPFLFFIPYTTEILQQIFVYLSIIIIAAVYLLRLIRIIEFILRKVVLYIYLFLYLCALEILPVLIITRIFLSLNQGS